MRNRRKAGTLAGGAKRMRELGYKQVQVWLDPRELDAIRKAHPAEKLASLLRRLACEDAGTSYYQR